MVCAILESDTVQKIEVLNDASTSLKLNHNHYPALFWMPESQSYILAEQGTLGFPGGPVVKNLPCNAGDTGSIPGQEDSTCCGATKPMLHNYRACALKPESCNYWAHGLQLFKLKTQQEKPQWSSHTAMRVILTPSNCRKAHAQQQRPSMAKK